MNNKTVITIALVAVGVLLGVAVKGYMDAKASTTPAA
jgi:hypothetical protein